MVACGRAQAALLIVGSAMFFQTERHS